VYWCVTLGCGSLIRFLVVLFVVVVLVAGSFCIKYLRGGGGGLPLVSFYGLLLFSCFLSISVISETQLLCIVLILSAVAFKVGRVKFKKKKILFLV